MEFHVQIFAGMVSEPTSKVEKRDEKKWKHFLFKILQHNESQPGTVIYIKTSTDMALMHMNARTVFHEFH